MNPEPFTVRVVRRFDAPPERVFDAWLDPQQLGRWMFGPSARTEGVSRVTFDPRPGGAFSFVLRRGDEEVDYVGLYQEITRPTRLTLSWGAAGSSANDCLLVLEFAPRENGCELTLSQTLIPDGTEHIRRIEDMWQTMLTALDAALR